MKQNKTKKRSAIYLISVLPMRTSAVRLQSDPSIMSEPSDPKKKRKSTKQDAQAPISQCEESIQTGGQLARVCAQMAYAFLKHMKGEGRRSEGLWVCNVFTFN